MNTEISMLLSVLLFACGLAVVLTRKNIIFILMGIELMLNATNLNLIFFSNLVNNAAEANFFTLLLMMVAACEMAIGLGLALKIRKYFKSIHPDSLKGKS